MSPRFRKIYLTNLKKLYADGDLCFHNKIESLNKKSEFQKLIDSLFAKDWVVFCKGNYEDHQNTFAYLSRYIYRVAIGNNKIIKIENDQVHVKYKDYADDNKSKTMVLDAKEFIRIFLIFVTCKVRFYGLLAHRNRNEKLTLCRDLLEVPEEECKILEIPDNWKDLYELITGKDALLCPYCKTGHLVYVEEIPIPVYAQGP